MREILHIFKKDIRRHLPEILVSVAFLGLYLKVTLQNPGPSSLLMSGFSWLLFSAESIPPLMVIFWIFLTVRAVQGEPLVGDRQWWITKPYEWWKLLAAKELFLLVFIGLPLFSVQLFLLHHAGFPIFSNLIRVLYMQISLAVVLFLPSIALGSLTRTLWQAVLTVVLALVAFTAVVSNLLEQVPSFGMSSAVDGLGAVYGLLLLASVIGAVGWQFARRKTWGSRGVVLTGPVLSILLAALIPYARFVDRKYPLVEPGAAPGRFVPVTPNPPAKKKNSLYEFSSVDLRIPLPVSGVVPAHAVQIDGIRVSVEAAGLPKWDSGWIGQWTQLWTENQETDLRYEMKRKDFDRIEPQPVRLHLEVALSEYEETEPRVLILPERRFSDPQLGICHLDERNPSVIMCLRPFQVLGLMANFDPSKANCEVPEDDQYVPDDRISHAPFSPNYNEDSSATFLNPLVDYSIGFGARVWWVPTQEGAKGKVKRVYLCPGAKITFAKPKELGHTRVQFDLERVRLRDHVNNPELNWNE